jgi:hypothetical protein
MNLFQHDLCAHQDLPEDQCVFIRGLRVTRTFKFLPKRLIGAAGPSTEPGGYDSEPDTEIMSIPATTKVNEFLPTSAHTRLMFHSTGILFT